MEGVVLAPLHYRDPNRLVMVWENDPRFPRVWNSYPNFQDWQRGARSFQQMAAFREQQIDLTFPGAPVHLKATQITSGFFSTLGTELALGREFTSQENQRGGAPVVVISHHLWRERFGGGPAVLGKTVTLDGVNYSIVGVVPPGFRLNDDADVYTPLGQLDALLLNNRASHDGIFTFARLKPGVSIFQSQAEMSTIQNHLDLLYPDDDRDLGIYVEPLKQVIVGDAGQTLALLLGSVTLVLLIACANIASLLLARLTARNREFAIRLALGANRARLARQLLTESIILSLLAAGLGSLLAFLGIRFAFSAMPGILPRSENVSDERFRPALHLDSLACSRNSVWLRAGSQEFGRRSANVAQGGWARFNHRPSSYSEQFRNCASSFNSRAAGGCWPAIAHNSSPMER
jgi:predicted permease